MDYGAADTESEKLNERIRSLLRLARGKANHNESLAALAAAKKLIEQNNLYPRDFGLKVPKDHPSHKAQQPKPKASQPSQYTECEHEWEWEPPPPPGSQVAPRGEPLTREHAINPLVEEMVYHEGWLLFTNWVKHRNVEQMWAECFDAPSMLWYAWLRGVPLGYQVLALCAVANLDRKRLCQTDTRLTEALKMMMQACVADITNPQTLAFVEAERLARASYQDSLCAKGSHNLTVDSDTMKARATSDVAEAIMQIAKFAYWDIANWPSSIAQRRVNDALRKVDSSPGHALNYYPEAADAVRKYLPFEVLREALAKGIFADGKSQYPKKWTSAPTGWPVREAERGGQGTPSNFCDQCGAKHSSGAKFCASCGTKTR